MEPGDIDRSIEFLLAQQAQFMADLQQSRELSDQRHIEISRAIAGLISLAGSFAEMDRRLGLRIDSVGLKLEALADAQRETEARLNALMLVVERYLRERSNGRGPADATDAT